MMIDILYDQPWPNAPDETTLQQAVLASLPDDKAGAICVRLADNQAVQSLNAQWRQKDAVTDILAFPMQRGAIDSSQPLGDLILAMPFVEQEASRLNIPLHNHIIHLIVHGTLHLLGFDHEEQQARHTMRQREREIMQQLQLHDPWPDNPLPEAAS